MAVPTSVLALALVAGFAALAALSLHLGGLEHAGAVPRAAIRAALQLAGVALVISGVLGSVPLSLAFLVVMAAVASLTAGRRISAHRSGLLAAGPILVGVLPALAALVGTGLVPTTGTALVPAGGILIGGAMTATALAGRLGVAALRDQHDLYEAALALGARPRDAALLLLRPACGHALVPALDQTRTVGTVTLPGAFVGMLLAGAGPARAAGVQLVVLVALLLVQSLAVIGVVELIARSWLRQAVPAADAGAGGPASVAAQATDRRRRGGAAGASTN
jgi:putative ABC transport system permease protein